MKNKQWQAFLVIMALIFSVGAQTKVVVLDTYSSSHGR